jgi:hypothetical protein
MTEMQFNPDGPDLSDPDLGLPGPAEPLPAGDHQLEEPTLVNDDDPEEGEDR